MNNWERAKFKTREEGILHVLMFLKKHEKPIVSHGLSSFTTISVGRDNMLVLGELNDDIGLEKKLKKDKK